jgi:hypothetical protein
VRPWCFPPRDRVSPIAPEGAGYIDFLTNIYHWIAEEGLFSCWEIINKVPPVEHINAMKSWYVVNQSQAPL